jgi:hypothetical protein
MHIRQIFRPQFCLLAAIAFAAASMTGCGVDSGIAPESALLSHIGGIVHGGPNPVIGASVNLYATTSGGYGAAGTLVGTGLTLNDGSFTITPVAACTSGQEAYITASGGNPGAGLTNPNYLLMAALGPCPTINSNTNIWVDEVTTVAAAYALRPFMTIDTSGATPVVKIGAPANNNAVTGSCTTVSNATTGCTAAGLSHAFANALNLVNSVAQSPAVPSGQAYQVTPSNANGVVPTALINSLANSIEACVNSNGGSAPSGASDGSTCGNVFAATTPPVTTPTAPTNTLQALLNVAQYPALTATQVTNLYSAPSGFTNYYQPALTTAPADFSMAIAYSGVTPAGNSGAVTSLTLTNINASGFGSGVAYTAVPTITLSAPTSGTTATATASLGLVYFNVTGGTCTAGTNPVTIAGGGGTGAAATATYSAAGAILSAAVTASGSGYTSVPTFSITNCTVQPTAAQKQKGLGVVSVAITNGGSGYTSAPTVTFSAATGTAPPTPVTATATANIGGSIAFNAPYALTLDANDDIYIGSQNALGAAGAYSYLSGMSANGSSLFTTAQNTTYTAPRGAATDTLGNIWVAQNNTTAIQGFTTAGAAAATPVLTTGTAPFGLGVDKANNVWYGIATTAAQNLFELQQSNAYTNVTFTPNLPAFTNPVRSIAFGKNQNVYVSGFNAATNTAGVFPNTNTAAVPAYGVDPVINATLTGNSGAGLALDSFGDAWAPTTTGLFEVVPTFGETFGITVTAFAPSGSSPLTDNVSTPNYDSVDGSGSVWVPNNGTSTQNIVQYVPGTGAANSYSPCYAANGGQTCAAALSQPQRTQVDSTGSVWITSLSNGRVYQLLGTGSPTWPQLSLGTPGVMPQ